MPRRLVLLFCLLIAFSAPAAGIAYAQTSSPFAPLPQATTTPDDSTTTTSTSSDDNGGLAAWQQVLIFLGGGVLIAGIGWAILSDARSHAPVEDETEVQHAAKLRKEDDIKRRKAKSRDASKRARAARKRNR
ncbi:hypothetical protein [Conexibacter woesei]|uniref:hypothetical protein n=1 Tax=Conexibacter woesei TaxID=191495 RepID=UPI0004189FA8|nr:hypothetical protein [Conexibacter woesei]